MQPVDEVPVEEAAAILGCCTVAVRRRVLLGVVSRSRAALTALAELAADVYRWREHAGDPASYWVTGELSDGLVGGERRGGPCVRLAVGARDLRCPLLDT